MKTSKLLLETSEKARVEIDRPRAAWSIPAHVEPFATLLEGSKKEAASPLPLSDHFVHRLLLRLERDGIASRER